MAIGNERFTNESGHRLATYISDEVDVSVGSATQAPPVYFNRDRPAVIHAITLHINAVMATNGNARINVGTKGSLTKYASFTPGTEAADLNIPVPLTENDIPVGEEVVVSHVSQGTGKAVVMLEIGIPSQDE